MRTNSLFAAVVGVVVGASTCFIVMDPARCGREIPPAGSPRPTPPVRGEGRIEASRPRVAPEPVAPASSRSSEPDRAALEEELASALERLARSEARATEGEARVEALEAELVEARPRARVAAAILKNPNNTGRLGLLKDLTAILGDEGEAMTAWSLRASSHVMSGERLPDLDEVRATLKPASVRTLEEIFAIAPSVRDGIPAYRRWFLDQGYPELFQLDVIFRPGHFDRVDRRPAEFRSSASDGR
ncbi:MAG: hypothetical protein R3F20_16620 [Planctomycetota bacterium]